MKNSIYITDLDHTFLRSDLSISGYSQEVWNRKSKESILSVATARSYSKTHEFLGKLHLKAPMILLDGSMIVTPEKKMISLKLINKKMGDAIIDEGSGFGIYPFVITLLDMDLNEGFLYPVKRNRYQALVLENYKGDPRMRECADIKAMDMNLKLVYFGDYQTLEPLSLHLQKIFGSELEYKLSPENYSNSYFLTILHPEADKSHALQIVCDYLGREVDDVTVFGDSLNDIGMFSLAGHAVAVANALEEVKAVADRVLPHTNDEDAVANYLDTLD